MSTVTSIESGETIVSSHAYPQFNMLPVTGFALLILGTSYEIWRKRK